MTNQKSNDEIACRNVEFFNSIPSEADISLIR